MARKKKPAEPTPEVTAPVMWAVMKAYSWSSLTVGGMSLGSPPEGPQRFVPVFDSREQAVEFDNGCEDNISIVRGA